jgi:predicted ATPase
VVSGGWTLEAAEAVWGDADVLDGLTALVQKSLLHYEPRDGEARYRFLETVRQCARDRLVEAGEVRDARNRHRDYFLALAEQAAWFDRLETELAEESLALSREPGYRSGIAMTWDRAITEALQDEQSSPHRSPRPSAQGDGRPG